MCITWHFWWISMLWYLVHWHLQSRWYYIMLGALVTYLSLVRRRIFLYSCCQSLIFFVDINVVISAPLTPLVPLILYSAWSIGWWFICSQKEDIFVLMLLCWTDLPTNQCSPISVSVDEECYWWRDDAQGSFRCVQSAVCKLCYWKGCPGNESRCWRRGAFFWGPVVSGVSGQIWEEICVSRSLWHPEHIPVTRFSMDTASNFPPWASPPYTSKDPWPVLQ